MPRINRPPAYRLHKARNCAVVTIDGKNHYLGPYGSPESHEKYARLIAEWRASQRHPLRGPVSPLADPGLSINELLLAYFRHVQTYYVKDGQPTSEQDNIRQALRFIRQLYGTSPAADFGPMALKNVRQAMIDAGRSRKLINKDVNRIRQMFGWAVENELLPVAVAQALREVKGLRRGRSAARETAPVMPVSEEHIRAILPHLSPQVAAMVRLQHLCGARPQEIISIRPCEIVTDGDVWLLSSAPPQDSSTSTGQQGDHARPESPGHPCGPGSTAIPNRTASCPRRWRPGTAIAPAVVSSRATRTVRPGGASRGANPVRGTRDIATAWRSSGPAAARAFPSGRRTGSGTPGRRRSASYTGWKGRRRCWATRIPRSRRSTPSEILNSHRGS